jgi:glycosyltransferase involved in cell wall biosynthesis
MAPAPLHPADGPDERASLIYRVLMTADLGLFPVPPARYGGAEMGVATMSRALCRRGHTVDLIAKAGSQRFNGELFTPPAPNASYLSRAACKILYQPVSLWAARHADIVHCHSRIDYLEALLRTRIPLAVHFHNDARQDHVDWLLGRRRRNIRLIAISRAQIAHLTHGDAFDIVHSVPAIRDFPFAPVAEEPPYLVFLGRVNHNKGTDVAIEVARRAGLPLKIVGPARNEEGNEAFYREKIAPFLGPDCVHLGEVSNEEKLRVLHGATAMIFPIRWNEPMGIVMIESLACGTPVIASNRASAPELITDGKTGFLCREVDEFVEAVRNIGRIRRSDCRREAEARFDAPQMVREIERVYARALAE